MISLPPVSKLRRLGQRLLCLCLLIAIAAPAINFYIINSAKAYLDPQEPPTSEAILILGCGVLPTGQPSAMLRDRLCTGYTLYSQGIAPKIIVSGDHGSSEYDEVNTMKNYLIDLGVPSADIFMDHAGFSTYESLYRARAIFLAEDITIVSQKYHLYRALYLAHALGIKATGVSADLALYRGQFMREIREILARNKDFFFALAQPLPTFLGETIPVSGSGDITND